MTALELNRPLCTKQKKHCHQRHLFIVVSVRRCKVEPLHAFSCVELYFIYLFFPFAIQSHIYYLFCGKYLYLDYGWLYAGRTNSM